MVRKIYENLKKWIKLNKTFNLHIYCISDVINEISYKYADKKCFLDIGCGDGSRSILFDEFGRKISGVDRINWLKQSLKNRINFRQEDFMKSNLSYESESFDIILLSDVIEHLADPRKVLKESYRILQKDGMFIISTPNRNRLFSFFLLFFGLRKFPHYPNKTTVDTDPYSAHIIEYTSGELESLLNQEGFRVIKSHKVFYGITGWYGFKSFFSFPFFHNIILECVKL